MKIIEDILWNPKETFIKEHFPDLNLFKIMSQNLVMVY